MSTARAIVRRALTHVLRWAPARLLIQVRDAYFRGAERAGQQRLRTSLLRWVLEVVRHRGIPEETFVVPDDPEVRFSRADSLILQRVYWLGRRGHEPELVRWWPDLCRRGTTVLEVGANVGYFTVYGARASPASYRAVEPHPLAAAALRRNLALNGLDGVEVIEAAAVPDDGPAFVELLVPRFDHFAAPAGTFVARTSEIERPSTRRFTVPARMFSELIEGADLVKLDVEGQEHALLRSGARHLREARPTLCVELLEGAPRLRSFLVELCAETQYRCLAPTPDRLVPVPLNELSAQAVLGRFGVRDVILTTDPDL